MCSQNDDGVAEYIDGCVKSQLHHRAQPFLVFIDGLLLRDVGADALTITSGIEPEEIGDTAGDTTKQVAGAAEQSVESPVQSIIGQPVVITKAEIHVYIEI